MGDELAVSFLHTIYDLDGKELCTLEGPVLRERLAEFHPPSKYIIHTSSYNKSGFLVAVRPRILLSKYLAMKKISLKSPSAKKTPAQLIDALLDPEISRVLSKAEASMGILPPSEVMMLVERIREIEKAAKANMGGVFVQN